MAMKTVDIATLFIVGPLVDNTDFKTLKTGVAYNAAGMDVSFYQEQADGTCTKTALTLTTGGSQDWVELGDGYYTVEVTAAQNNTECSAWVAGVTSAELPFESGRFDMVPANVVDSLIKGTDALQVHTNEMTAGVITATVIATDAIDADAMADGAITAATFAAGAITATVIATDAIDDDAIATGAIASTAFAAGAITAAAIATDAIDADAMADGAITAATFAAGAIDAAAIATNAIDDDAIATGAIASTAFAAGAITAAAIATDAIDADALAADAVAEIADGVWDELTSGHTTSGSFGLLTTDHARYIIGDIGVSTSDVLRAAFAVVGADGAIVDATACTINVYEHDGTTAIANGSWTTGPTETADNFWYVTKTTASGVLTSGQAYRVKVVFTISAASVTRWFTFNALS